MPDVGLPAHTAGRARAFLVLLGIGGLLLVVTTAVAWSLVGMFSAGERTLPAAAADTPDPAGPVTGSGPSAEAQLAGAPMLALPASAASPHELTTRTAGPPITLPAPARVAGSVVATGFPPTPEGALAQLVELMSTGMAGGDPRTWALAYESLAEEGAAPAGLTWTSRELVDLRRGANMAPTGPARPGLTMSWTPTSAMVKGTTGDGSYLVGCVLGEFVADHDGRVVTAGWGNCLPMRLVGGEWRIASGPTAAPAPSAWPGSSEAVTAGWREITR